MTIAAVEILMNRVHELETTLAMMESRMTVIATGGTLPAGSLLRAVAEARRVLESRPAV
jgi:hypothetical protein